MVPLCGVASVRGWATGLHLHYRKETKVNTRAEQGREEEMGLLVTVFEVVVFWGVGDDGDEGRLCGQEFLACG